MNYIKTYEIFNFLKSKSKDDEIALQIIRRLEKVKDENPYEIRLFKDDYDYMPKYSVHQPKEVPENVMYYKIYFINFDDVEVCITNDKYALLRGNPGQQRIVGYKKSEYPYKLFIAGQYCLADKKYRKKIYQLTDRIYYEDLNRKRIDDIEIEMNDGADLL